MINPSTDPLFHSFWTTKTNEPRTQRVRAYVSSELYQEIVPAGAQAARAQPQLSPFIIRFLSESYDGFSFEKAFKNL